MYTIISCPFHAIQKKGSETHTVEPLAERPLPTAPGDLPLAVRDVIANGVSQDVVESVGLGDVPTRPADDGDELALKVEPCGLLG